MAVDDVNLDEQECRFCSVLDDDIPAACEGCQYSRADRVNEDGGEDR